MKKPAVTMRVNDSDAFPAIVDTGSDHTLVPRAFVRGGITRHDPIETLQFLGKERLVQRRRLRITIGDRFEETVDALVFVDPKDEIAVLGTDFLQARHCRVSLRPARHWLECRGGAGKRAGRVRMTSLLDK